MANNWWTHYFQIGDAKVVIVIAWPGGIWKRRLSVFVAFLPGVSKLSGDCFVIKFLQCSVNGKKKSFFQSETSVSKLLLRKRGRNVLETINLSTICLAFTEFLSCYSLSSQSSDQNIIVIFPYQSSSIVKTAKIYDTCVDTAAIERRGISPLENLIEQYGGWTVTGNGTNSSWTVAEKMGAILRDLNVQSLLSVSVITDLDDSSKHSLRVSATSMYYIKHDRACLTTFPTPKKSVENATHDDVLSVWYIFPIGST